MEVKHQTIARIPLPRTGGSLPVVLHTIVADLEGNLYFSDEFNHRVGAMRADGQLLWSIGGIGSDLGRFWYPRGISLGWIEHNGSRCQCLAVCDSWNRRMQFLSCDGVPILCWEDRERFGEIGDVRYLPSSDVSLKNHGNWLVLDRGNNRLCVFDQGGMQLFTVGRTCPPELETRWNTRGMLPTDLSGFVYAIVAQGGFDPLFYPSRILGFDPKALFIWEPLSGKLKQILFGNLLSLLLNLPDASEWITADCEGFASWSASHRRLHLHDKNGEVWWDACVDGTPVASDLCSNEVWLQSADELIRLRWQKSVESEQSGKSFVPLLRSLKAQAAEWSIEFPIKISQELCTLLSEVKTLTDDLMAMPAAKVPDSALLVKVGTRMQELIQDLHTIRLGLDEWATPSFSFERCAMIGAYGLVSGALPPQFERIGNILKDLSDQVSGKLVDLQQHLDELVMARTGQPEIPKGSVDLLGAWKTAVENQELAIIDVIKKILPWAGVPSADSPIQSAVALTSESRIPPETEDEYLLKLPLARLAAERAGCFREIDRISLAASSNSPPVRPYGLTRTSNGHLYVSLFGAGRIASLDDRGHMLGILGRDIDRELCLQDPVGIAADTRDRLWILELKANRINIWDPANRSIEAIRDRARTPVLLNSPHGITPAPDGAMLIADTGNHRIVRIWSDDKWEDIGVQAGSGPGQVRHPFGFCLDEAHSCLWIVDHRNHRIQKLAADDELPSIIGGCGFRRGDLLWPESAAIYADGTIAVAQGRLTRTLKLFSPAGEELSSRVLDFMPGGMLISKDILFITEFDGNSIRIFERAL